ncbi:MULTISPECIES: Rieske (2Fe-2S) protein [Streptomyces]|uniref:Cytochrome bc1 complex Rieske iron-sulfur subunit n=2 Tax=Streptomyces griseus TaxID=1911 RepID=B1W218_STRGG|nr:Rieske (2Fe-2S) protein [Streptomyces griseus]MYR09719.1 Rieske 2Fe-2S domain-containing protein [Streptomyces sp. SID724]BAG22565.1 putative iron sulphur protein [Streptomyces griseus subsp. griseus NBRC 13350]SEE50554.1 Ferredoxin subunit of nitrite reductase or a ring-hydroxylating dioxygenase [Streptomyces griseus]SQA22353.1 iron sulfur protein [Streptomyces griseus]
MNARRRTVLAAGAAGAAALATGCGSSGGDGGGDTSATPTATGDATGGAELARTGDIPVGGGTVLKERKVVVTQPEEGEFKAFSAVCTHASCLVSTVSDGTINCPCHGSRFSITDASVEAGPATRPLPAERISVSGGTIRLG